MKLNKTILAAALSLLASGAALADITIGVSLPLTGPASGLGIPVNNQLKLWPATIAGAGFQRVQRGLAAPAVQRAAGDHLPVAGERPQQYVIRALDETGHEVHRHLVFPAGPENSAADDPGCFARMS